MSNKKLFQILLPLYGSTGKPVPVRHFSELRAELTEHFGGLTTYSRTPAKGRWKDPDDDLKVDEIIVYEVMAEKRDLKYWKILKTTLEKQFDQKEILIRSFDIDTI